LPLPVFRQRLGPMHRHGMRPNRSEITGVGKSTTKRCLRLHRIRFGDLEARDADQPDVVGAARSRPRQRPRPHRNIRLCETAQNSVVYMVVCCLFRAAILPRPGHVLDNDTTCDCRRFERGGGGIQKGFCQRSELARLFDRLARAVSRQVYNLHNEQNTKASNKRQSYAVFAFHADDQCLSRRGLRWLVAGNHLR